MFKARTFFFLAAAVLVTVIAMAEETPVYPDEPSGAYLRDWLVCGPIPTGGPQPQAGEVFHLAGFQTDYLAAAGGEAAATPKSGDKVAFDGGEALWKGWRSGEDCVQLDQALGNSENVLGYAYAEITSAKTHAVACALGTNDGGRMWVNDECVWDSPAPRGLQADDEIVPVLLREGRNRVLLKIEERGNLWGFCCRFLPLSADLLDKRFRIFRVTMEEGGAPALEFQRGEALAKALLERARLRVSPANAPAETVWEGDWSSRYKMSLPVDAAAYGAYVLHIDATLAGGLQHSMEMPFTAGVPVEYTLFEKGQSNYAIVVGVDASPSEQWAAQELRHWLREVSGAELPMRDDAGPLAGPAIVVGFNRVSAQLPGADMTPPADGDESFLYRNAGENIVIAGGKQRGTMYGVMTFLERELGVRWYTPRVTVAPKKDSCRFRILHHREKPGIRVRNDFYFEAFDPIWAAHNKVNGAMSHREQPGGVECYWSVHTFFPLMPPQEFYAEHPEYYSLVDGQRVADRAQLCLTNPDVLRILTGRLLDVIRKNPQYLIYSVSQNDWANPCQCESCQAIARREESESGPVVWFVNQVAEAVEQEFPDKFVGTLAYQYTRKPPKTIKPRQNVVIRLCSIECCFAHDFNSCPENGSFITDLRGWAAIAPHMYIWDYVVNFSHYTMPYPNFRVLQPNIQTFRDNNAIGIMEQAAYQSRGGEFAELRAYLIAKLLWDPECGVNAVIDDFMYGYYGRSGQYVRQYFDALHNRLTPNTHIHLGLRPDDPLFSDEFVRESEALFDRAETVADTEEIRQRVEMARLPVMYLKCKRAPVQARIDGTYARFCEIVAREGVTLYAEAGQAHKEAFHQEVENAR